MEGIPQVTYEVSVDGLVYKYALHSTKKQKIIYPSQILNILEYCLFKLIKNGWNKQLTFKTFPFEITKLEAGKDITESWEDKDVFHTALLDALSEYYDNFQ